MCHCVHTSRLYHLRKCTWLAIPRPPGRRPSLHRARNMGKGDEAPSRKPAPVPNDEEPPEEEIVVKTPPTRTDKDEPLTDDYFKKVSEENPEVAIELPPRPKAAPAEREPAAKQQQQQQQQRPQQQQGTRGQGPGSSGWATRSRTRTMRRTRRAQSRTVMGACGSRGAASVP